MVKTIICSVGTSSTKKLGIHVSRLEEWVKSRGSVEKAGDLIFKSFEDYEPNENNLRDSLSAEIHSCFQIGISNSDKIILLTSETDDGYACGLAVEKYFRKYWNNVLVKTERIIGLQVEDAKRFAQTGVINFLKKVSQEIQSYGSKNIILNPTGGYKALVPYTVLIGMLKEVQCNYIFERSPSLLTLPAIPVEFNRSKFESYQELFEKIDHESSISLEEWQARVSFYDRQQIESLVEIDQSDVTFSAVGFLFFDEMRNPTNYIPYLSQKAFNDCFDNLRHLDDCDPFRFLTRVAQSPQLFAHAEHINVGQGLRWLKPGNTTDRYLVSIEGYRLLVWRAIREDQVGSDYANQVVVNPDNERNSYLPFMRLDGFYE
jgi:putative CRISPR-associated protein (TIGR02619 family)